MFGCHMKKIARLLVFALFGTISSAVLIGLAEASAARNLASSSFGHLSICFCAMPIQESELAAEANNSTDASQEGKENDQDAVDDASTSLSSKILLPASTRAWVSIPDYSVLESHFKETQIGTLVESETVKPFFDELKEQWKKMLDERNVRIGLSADEIFEIRVGEIAIAGVFQDLEGGQPARGSHGLVLLVEVTNNEAKVIEMLDRVNQRLVEEKDAVVETVDIFGISVRKVAVQNLKRIRHSRFTFQGMANGWLLVADNEEIFRDILRRLVAPKAIDQQTTFAAQSAFQKTMSETELFGASAQFSWFVDPFGYLQLAQKIQEEDQEIRQRQEDWASILKDAGLDAIEGVGGNMALKVDVDGNECESISRIFVSAPRDNLTEKQRRIFDLLDFTDRKPGAIEPNDLVSNESSGFFGGSWNFLKLLNSVGFIYDAISKQEGDFERMLEDFKTEPDFQVDIRRMVGMVDDQIFLFSEIGRPISLDSEQMAIGFPLKEKANVDLLMRSIKRAAKGSTEINLAGFAVIEIDSTYESEMDFEDDLSIKGLGFEDDFLEDPQDTEKKFSMFEKRYIASHQGVLLLTNNKDYLRKLLTNVSSEKLRDAADFQRIKQTLAGFTNPEKVSFLRFSRLDRSIETNYQMFRSGQMVNSQTLIAKILNQLFESEQEQDSPVQREQKVDGSKLPENFDIHIAPFLGPAGWVTEAEDDGWRITGCTLAK